MLLELLERGVQAASRSSSSSAYYPDLIKMLRGLFREAFGEPAPTI